MKEVPFKTLTGYTLENIFSRKEVIFTTKNGSVFVLLNTITNYRQEGDDASVLNSPITTAKYSFNKKKYKFQTDDEHSFTIETATGICTFSWLGGNPKLYEVTEDDNDELCVRAKTISDSPTIFANFKSEEEVYFHVVGKAGLEFYTKTDTLYGSVEELATTLLGSAKPLYVTNLDNTQENQKMKITVINFTYNTSKSREYHGCPVVTGVLDGVKVREVGYGYDMVGSIISSFINKGLVSQDYLEKSYFNSRLNPKTGKYYVNMCSEEVFRLLEDYGYTVKLNYLKGTLVSLILVK